MSSLGFGLNKKSMAFIATNFCGKEGGLGLDDFVLVSVKTQTLYGMYCCIGSNSSNVGTIDTGASGV